MEIFNQEPKLVVMLLLIFPLMFWSGLINGEALAALVNRKYSGFMIRHKRFGWITLLMMYPAFFAADAWFIYWFAGGIERKALIKSLCLVPLWGGLLGGFSAWYLPSIRMRRITYMISALAVVVISAAFLPDVLHPIPQSIGTSSVKLNLLAGSSLATFVLAAANMGYLMVRIGNPDDEIVKEILDTAETVPLRNIVERLQLDGSIVTELPAYTRSKLRSGYVADSKIDLTAMPKPEGLFLRFTHGLNPGYELQQFPTVKHVLWMKIQWDNVSDLQMERLIGYKESKVVLKNSGVTIAISGAGRAIGKHLNTSSTGRSDKATNVQARA